MRTSILLCVSLVVLIFVVTGCIPVKYTVEYKDSCIKFEDAMTDQDPEPDIVEWVEDCLGEDGAVEGDVFVVMYEGESLLDPSDITVKLKAGKCKNTIEGLVLSPDYPPEDNVYEGTSECGFKVLGTPRREVDDADGAEDAWVFAVISDDIPGGKDGTKALSYVMFCLDGVIVVGPEEGEFMSRRFIGEEEIEEAIDNYLHQPEL